MANEKDFEFSDDEFDEWEDENESEEKKNKKEKKPKERVQLPIFLELVYSFALIFTILLALVVAGMSLSVPPLQFYQLAFCYVSSV